MGSLRLSALLVVASVALLASGCGSEGGNAGSTSTSAGVTATEPTTGPAETQTDAPPSEDVAARAGELCTQLLDTLGSLDTPKGEDEVAVFEERVAAAEQTYRDGVVGLPVAPEDQATLERFVAAHEDLADARAAARAERNPGSPEETDLAADATATAEELGLQLGIPGCAGA